MVGRLLNESRSRRRSDHQDARFVPQHNMKYDGTYDIVLAFYTVYVSRA